MRFVRNQATTVDTWGLITQRTLGASVRHTPQLSLQRGEGASYLPVNSHQSSTEGTLVAYHFRPALHLDRTDTIGQRESEGKALQVLIVGSQACGQENGVFQGDVAGYQRRQLHCVQPTIKNECRFE